MLVYLLAIASGSGSLALFLTAFFIPEIHRKGDFLWSGVGLFYALVLWVLSAQINGGLLLGETAGVAMLLWAIVQVLQTRWKSVPIEQRSAPSVKLVNKIEKVFSDESLQKLQDQAKAIAAKFDRSKTSKIPKPEVPAPEVPTPIVTPDTAPEVTLEVESAAIPTTDPDIDPKTATKEPPSTSDTPELNTPELNTLEPNIPELNTIEAQDISPHTSPEPVNSPLETEPSLENPASVEDSIDPSHGGENSTENSLDSNESSDSSSNSSSNSEGEDS